MKKGIGAVHRGEDLVKHDDRANIVRYDKLIDRLLKIEVKLDKKRENRRWKNLTLLQKIKEAYSNRSVNYMVIKMFTHLQLELAHFEC